jgi:hypothetical protein
MERPPNVGKSNSDFLCYLRFLLFKPLLFSFVKICVQFVSIRVHAFQEKKKSVRGAGFAEDIHVFECVVVATGPAVEECDD